MDPLTPFPLDHVALRAAPQARALILPGESLDYQELNARVGRLAALLAARLAPGERVASWTGKGLVACLMPLAAARAGLIHVPIHPALKRAQVCHILEDSGARLLITNEARLAALGEAELPLLDEREAAAAARADGPALPPLAPGTDLDGLVALLYTSGSTGRPKGVMLSHANLMVGALSVARYLELGPDDVTLAVLPLSFDYGQNQLLSTWAAGGALVPLDYLTPRDVMTACARHAVTTLAAVPPLWWQLVEQEWGPAADSLRRLTNSGGALTAPLVRALRTRFDRAKLFAMYGLTEAFRSTCLDPALIDAHPTAIGTAVPGAEVMVVRPDGSPAAVGEAGELVHAGPLVAMGYWRDPQRTAARFRPAPAWSALGGTAVWSGDRVMRDGEGLLHFVGRDDAMIKTSGHRVSPTEVEEGAVATGLVTQACALGVPDPRLGQAIRLFVAGEEGVVAPLARALRAALPGFMQPREIVARPALPLTPNGKIDRAALAREDAGA